MPCDTQSPSPVPFPRFVEKNGSKIRAMSSSGIPSPVSRTWIWTASRPKTSVSVPAPACVATVIVPPFGIESAALSRRLRRTCFSWSADAREPRIELGRDLNPALAKPFRHKPGGLLSQRVEIGLAHSLLLAVEAQHLPQDP